MLWGIMAWVNDSLIQTVTHHGWQYIPISDADPFPSMPEQVNHPIALPNIMGARPKDKLTVWIMHLDDVGPR